MFIRSATWIVTTIDILQDSNRFLCVQGMAWVSPPTSARRMFCNCHIGKQSFRLDHNVRASASWITDQSKRDSVLVGHICCSGIHMLLFISYCFLSFSPSKKVGICRFRCWPTLNKNASWFHKLASLGTRFPRSASNHRVSSFFVARQTSCSQFLYLTAKEELQLPTRHCLLVMILPYAYLPPKIVGRL